MQLLRLLNRHTGSLAPSLFVSGGIVVTKLAVFTSWYRS
jgi:hypothetical protein